jgi:hypothetical protein
MSFSPIFLVKVLKKKKKTLGDFCRLFSNFEQKNIDYKKRYKKKPKKKVIYV